jgi:hypothetical protein
MRRPASNSDLLVFGPLKALALVAHLVRVAQGNLEHPFVARVQRDDVLAGCEDHLAEDHHALLADCVADDGKCLLSDLPIWCDVVGVPKVKISPGPSLLLRQNGPEAVINLALRDLFLLFGGHLKVAGIVEGWRHEYLEVPGINTERNGI